MPTRGAPNLELPELGSDAHLALAAGGLALQGSAREAGSKGRHGESCSVSPPSADIPPQMRPVVDQ